MTGSLVICAGIYGSGSTWLYNVVSDLRVAEYGSDQVFGTALNNVGDFVKTAPPAPHLILKLHQGDATAGFLIKTCQVPTVVSLRDPRDAVVSFMHRFKKDFEYSLNIVAENCAFVQSILQKGRQFLVRYEDNFVNDIETIRSVAAFLDSQRDEVTIEQIFDCHNRANVEKFLSEFDSLPEHRISESGTFTWDKVTLWHKNHLGDGAIGKWRTALSEAEQQQATERLRPWLVTFAYETNDTLSQRLPSRKADNRSDNLKKEPRRNGPMDIEVLLSQNLSVANSTYVVNFHRTQVELLRYQQQELAQPRYQDARRLSMYGYKVYSQGDEDGLIAEIFRRIGEKSRTFIEFGVDKGHECNTFKLLAEGWRGLWLEGNGKACETIRHNHAQWLANKTLWLVHAFVTAENINDLLRHPDLGTEIDLMSIDIDYNDFWVWKAIEVVRPRVVVIEYNATWRPPLSLTVPYNPAGHWNYSTHYGASLEALNILGRKKGYRLVGCSFTGVNAFFVREEDCGDKFTLPATAAEHYEPPRYFLTTLQMGHPAGAGGLVTVRESPQGQT